jgi:hypothetical protein
MLNEGNQIHNFISSSGSGTVIHYGSGSGSTRQKVTVPTVPVPVPKRCRYLHLYYLTWRGSSLTNVSVSLTRNSGCFC